MRRNETCPVCNETAPHVTTAPMGTFSLNEHSAGTACFNTNDDGSLDVYFHDEDTMGEL